MGKKKNSIQPKTMLEIMKSSPSEVTKSLFTGAYYPRTVESKKIYKRCKNKKIDRDEY